MDLLRTRVRRVHCDAAELLVERGTVHVELLERARAWGANVLVVGGGTPFDRYLGSGRVTKRVLREANCHVLVARDSDACGRVVAATDLAGPLFPAIVAGAREASRRGARLEVVRPVGFLDVEVSQIVGLSVTSAGADVFETFRHELSTKVARLGIRAECRVIDQPAAPAIVAEARAAGAELIVLRAPNERGLRGLRRRRIAEQVVRMAACSVLVVGPSDWPT